MSLEAFNEETQNNQAELLKGAQQTGQVTTINKPDILNPEQSIDYYNRLGKVGVSSENIELLKGLQQQVVNIFIRTSFELGKVYFEAQELLIEVGKPELFNEFVMATGAKPKTAKEWIKNYTVALSMTDDQKEIFENLPAKLQNQMATQLKKPNEEIDDAHKEALDSVFKGDITTLPEYKALIKQHEEDLRKERNINDDKQHALDSLTQQKIMLEDELENTKKSVSKQTLDVESTEAYQNLKKEHEEAIRKLTNLNKEFNKSNTEIERLQKDLESLQDKSQEFDETEEEYKEYQSKINIAKTELEKAKEAKVNINNSMELLITLNQAMDTASPFVTRVNFADSKVRNETISTVKRMKQFINMMEQQIPDYEDAEFEEVH